MAMLATYIPRMSSERLISLRRSQRLGSSRESSSSPVAHTSTRFSDGNRSPKMIGCAPKTHYAISKRATEDIAALYSGRFPIIITRPFNYTGPGQTTNFLVPRIVLHYVEHRSEIRLGNLDLFRDYSDISRVVEAYSRLLSGSVGPTTTNICSGRALHLVDILKFMNELSGRTIRVVTDPSLVRSGEPQCIVGSPARLESLVGPLPNPEFRETLTRMYNEFSDQPSSGEYGRQITDHTLGIRDVG